jgi:AraC-like DNA-binding protein
MTPTTALAASTLSLYRTLEARGVDADALFKSHGLDPQLFFEQGARVRSEVTRRLWEAAVAASGDPCLGLDVGRYQQPSSTHGLAYAWHASATLASAMQRLARYMRVISDAARVWTEDEAEGTKLALRAPTGDRPLPAGVQDAFMASVIAAARSTFGTTFTPIAMRFRHSRPPCADRFEALFRCPIGFDAPESSMLIAREDLARPLPTANAELALANDRVLQDYLARMDRENIVDRVRRFAIERLPAGAPSEHDAAAALALSRRTLLRRLNEAGTNFRKLLDDTRRELALERLAAVGTPVNEIAYMLGFADAASFNRAFKRWTGASPSEYRNRTA